MYIYKKLLSSTQANLRTGFCPLLFPVHLVYVPVCYDTDLIILTQI